MAKCAGEHHPGHRPAREGLRAARLPVPGADRALSVQARFHRGRHARGRRGPSSAAPGRPAGRWRRPIPRRRGPGRGADGDLPRPLRGRPGRRPGHAGRPGDRARRRLRERPDAASSAACCSSTSTGSWACRSTRPRTPASWLPCRQVPRTSSIAEPRHGPQRTSPSLTDSARSWPAWAWRSATQPRARSPRGAHRSVRQPLARHLRARLARCAARMRG